ncbi:MAG: HlyC/CorC family transporter [Actinobacteria bacterium]|nr:HlyC/CorC family transporter [Actinomycetota bacterium]
MNVVWSTLGALALVIAVGALFVAAEMALVSLRPGQVRKIEESRRRAAGAVSRLTGDPNRFLAAAQVGVTLTGIVSGAFGVTRLEPIVSGWLRDAHVPAASAVAFILITLVTGFLTLVFGELVPKRIALQRSEQVAVRLAGPLDALARLFRPFVWLLSASTDLVVRLVGGDPGAARESISGEELRGLVASHEELTAEERNLIDDVFQAGDRELREVMVPRTEVDFLDADIPAFKAVKIVTDQPHSRYPVTGEGVDDILGFVHIRDILAPDMAERSIRVGQIAREVRRYPGTKRVIPTLTDMRRAGAHLAIVLDEYGGTAGIVTLEDLVEELVGDIRDEYDVASQASQNRTGDGQFEIDGLTNIEDLDEDFGVELPDGPYETVAGFMVAHLGRLPREGDRVEVAGAHFTVASMEGRRISRVKVHRLSVED